MSSNLTKSQLDAVTQFASFTSAPESIAHKYLSVTKWDVAVAVDNYFAHPPDDDELAAAHAAATAAASTAHTAANVSKPPTAAGGAGNNKSLLAPDNSPFKPAALSALFDAYCDPRTVNLNASDDGEGGAVIGEAGLQRLCTDLGIEVDDIIVLALAWKLKTATLGEFTRREFLAGCTELKVDSVSKLRARLDALRNELAAKPLLYKEFYVFMFQLLMQSDQQKSLGVDEATAMWSIFFKKWPLVDKWNEFVGTVYKKAISKDVWGMLHDFSTANHSDVKNYDESACWPVLMDEFVEWYNKNKK
jgi:hypothetical protein